MTRMLDMLTGRFLTIQAFTYCMDRNPILGNT